ncbi:HAMP domain-containing histidine kinase [Nonomuraea sp. K274]|uniref:histidine kinase n=1 Tax=Nonomuraea cypriaca TaxID=1187855 RepID=A0A931AD19_9ACTN|nr:HAMP domain-containing sensor histidine kinase [Nonomuraea cypriaca]MBF8190606.1 HAMP domain-containing histidine kinase [Nonomuraea cypriaca]
MLVFLTVIGASVDFLVLNRAEEAVFQDSLRVAAGWLQSLPSGPAEQPVPETRIDLLQLVDSHGQVVTASAAAAGRAPLTTLRPPADDPEQHRTECTADGCVMVTALRVPSLVTEQLWRGEPHFIYVGMKEPPILATWRLEYLTGAGVVLGTALVAWGNWWLAGRSLRQVAAIRERLSEITVSDLSLRVPTPPGHSEYARLAGTVNETLAQLEEAVKQQRRFASTASHELRTPLAGLRTRLEEAVLYPGDVDPRETIDEALPITERLETIVDDLLVLARLRSGGPTAREPIDLAALVKEEAASRTVPGGVPIHVDATPGVTLQGNRIQLIRVLDNLLANARRHTRSRIDVTAGRVGDQAVVTVTDDGDGIAPQDRERVFERFVRLEDSRRREPGGSGLGLAISRDIAHAHDGTLVIEDSPRGARFVLRLPAANTPPEGSTVGKRPDPPAEPRSQTPAEHGVTSDSTGKNR